MALSGAHPLAGTIAAWMWLLPVFPLLGFLINGAFSIFSVAHIGPGDPDMGHGGHDEPVGDTAHAADAHGAGSQVVSRPRFAGLVSIIGPSVILLSFLLAVAIFVAMRSVDMSTPFIQRYWSWIPVGDLHLDFAFQLDQLSMVMVLIVTGVSTLIHVFSIGYMGDDPGYARFFSYLNLFVFFMLLLVLANNYALLYVGWEGVSLCSYLLVGFWFLDKVNADAGKKAFLVNRIGDVGLLIGMFLLFANLGSLDFTAIAASAGSMQVGGALVTTICLFFFFGCTGKSAQLPLYVWLPDAMAGPTPVSALIHAATMVTAGVYLVVRSSFLFSMAPLASITVAVVGAITALFAATVAIKQWDIKKVLAYSTVSQLGYMFIGVGVGAYSAGIFHLATHAFFKGLLFLGAGSVIYTMHAAYHHSGSHADAQDMRNMGGMRKAMPVTWVMMWIATLAISGIPPFAGFFSKDSILNAAYEHSSNSALSATTWLGISGHTVLLGVYVLGLAAALLTAVYMTRLMLYTFHGPSRASEDEQKSMHEAPWTMTGPIVVLGLLSLIGGWLNLPAIASFLGPMGGLDHWLDPVVGAATHMMAGGMVLEASHGTELALIGTAVIIAVAGIGIALFALKPASLVLKTDSPEEHGFEKVLAEKYYIDEIYESGIVHPAFVTAKNVLWRGLDVGIIDNLFVNGSAAVARGLGWIGAQIENGSTSVYAWGIALGAIVVLSVFSFR
ncbi:MAG TPA: NADH-quinone oxidoreductase subunit L [Gemmatimonadaceae bacterium]